MFSEGNFPYIVMEEYLSLLYCLRMYLIYINLYIYIYMYYIVVYSFSCILAMKTFNDYKSGVMFLSTIYF